MQNSPVTQSNERMEFLGDAIIDFVTAEYLCERFPELTEGEMTTLRAAVVRSETLASLAVQIGLAPHLRLSRGEENTGARARVPILADAFEAVVGAIFIDQGLDATREISLKLLVPVIERVRMEHSVHDAKSILQEVVQAYHHVQPRYELVETRGADHARVFVMAVFIGETNWGQGDGATKHSAEQAAAYSALIRMRTELANTQERTENHHHK